MTSSIYPRFRLDQWTTLRLQLLWAYRKLIETADKPQHPGHFPFHTAALVCEGWAEAQHEGTRRIRANAGQWLVLRQGLRWQRFSKDCELLSIGFRFQLPTGEAVFDEGFPLRFASADHPGLEREAWRVLRHVRKSIGEGYYLRQQMVDMREYLLAQNALRLFLLELAGVFHACGIRQRTMSPGNPHVLRVLDIIEHLPTGQSVTGASIAKQVGLTITHLDRLMLAQTGHTVHQQIELRRIQRAQDALLARASSLKAIAYDLGFSSPSHFHRWFKKTHNMTPLQYSHQFAIK